MKSNPFLNQLIKENHALKFRINELLAILQSLQRENTMKIEENSKKHKLVVSLLQEKNHFLGKKILENSPTHSKDFLKNLLEYYLLNAELFSL